MSGTSGTSAPSQGALHARRNQPRYLEVGPSPTGNLPSGVADRILATFLLEDGVARRLSRAQQSAVLHPTVELAEYLLAPVAEIAPSQETTTFGVHRDLEVWLRNTGLREQHPAAALTHTLATTVSEVNDAGGVATAPGRMYGIESGRQKIFGGQGSVQCVVGGDHRRDEADHPAEIEDRPGRSRDLDIVHHGDLIPAQPADVTGEIAI